MTKQKKKILLAIPTVHGISELVEKNLKFYNFDVINISRNDKEKNKFKYPSLWDHFIVKLRKIILKDKKAKTNLQSKLLTQELDKIFPQNEKFDYALFFLAQCYSLRFIEHIRNKTKNGLVVNYQWDGMDRFKDIYNYINLFDRFFVFDPSDLPKNDRLLPSTSFYFDFDLTPLPSQYDFYYLGAHRDDRSELVIQFAKFAEKMGFNINMNIVLPVRRNDVAKLYPKNVTILQPNEVKDFKDNLLSARQSKILLDFVISEHNGLSLRTFEALGHNKKLITTNKEIKKYDFYHPNNIFILDNNFDEIPNFLEKPYQPVAQEIKEKYSFRNWINYVLDIQPHQPILLPEDNYEEDKKIS